MLIHFPTLLFLLPFATCDFFIISDIHLDIAFKSNYNSTYYCHSVLIQGQTTTPKETSDIQPLTRPFCDSSFNLVESSLSEMQSIDSDPEFILITGDFVAHYTSSILTSSGSFSPTYSQTLVQETFQQLSSLFNKFFPNTQIIPVIGNNDGYADYEMPTGLEKLEYLEFLYSVWQPLSKDLSRKFLTDGYYSIKSKSGLNVIVLNSNFFSINYQNIGLQGGVEMIWLKGQLEGNNNNIIVMHIPPSLTLYSGGKLSWYDYYSDIVLELIGEYSENINAILAGHYHIGSFQLIGQIPILINPSISPYFGNNPGFRYYNSNFTDFLQYNLNGYNVTGEWKSYSFSSLFGYDLNFTRLYQDLYSGKVGLYEYLRSINGLWLNLGIPDSQVCLQIFGSACSNGNAYLKQLLLCEIIYHTYTQFEECMNNSTLIEEFIAKSQKASYYETSQHKLRSKHPVF